MSRPLRLLTTCAVASLVLAGACSSAEEDEAAGELPRIVVTTSILGDVVSSLVGDEANVEVLIPSGVDPHDFEASARQAADLRDADLVVTNGLGLEVSLVSTLESAQADGVTIVEVGSFVDPLVIVEHDHTDDDHTDDDHTDDDHDHGEFDPHFWHDPTRMASAISPLVEAMIEAVPRLDTPELGQRADDLVDVLAATDAEVAEVLASVRAERRYLVTNHDTFGYFADRYGFEVIGALIAGGDTQARPSAGALAALVAEIERYDLPAIFAENVADSDLADALAAELSSDVAVISLYTDSLGEAGSGAETYTGMLRTNARLIADALSG